MQANIQVVTTQVDEKSAIYTCQLQVIDNTLIGTVMCNFITYNYKFATISKCTLGLIEIMKKNGIDFFIRGSGELGKVNKYWELCTDSGSPCFKTNVRVVDVSIITSSYTLISEGPFSQECNLVNTNNSWYISLIETIEIDSPDEIGIPRDEYYYKYRCMVVPLVDSLLNFVKNAQNSCIVCGISNCPLELTLGHEYMIRFIIDEFELDLKVSIIGATCCI